ncbi:hypothetical protein LTR36_004669 [Oleoguttula mirabilis]|uniref:Uncharacterized protein n=1 Tax=Oleoguttula mirabilis TaxID=1507867 RepID=A0AAV9JFS2_9PEZI|nr:hypothetical protein LTR36_004669 [Oleoguttula mirabilis]
MAKNDKVLVYHYRHNGQPAVKDGLAVISRQQLQDILKNNPGLQSGSKAIPRGAMSVEIYQRDLITPSPTTVDEQHPNYDANIAGIKLPLSVWLGSALTGAYSELVILSKKL